MLKRRNFALIVLFFIAFVQTTVLNRIKIWDIKPDLLLLTTIFFALSSNKKNETSPLVFGLEAGLLKDLFANNTLGINASSFVICSLVIRHYRQRIYSEHFITYLLLSFFLYIFIYLFYYFINKLLYLTATTMLPPFLNSLYYIVLPFSIYTTLFSIPYFYLLKKLLMPE